ncbi:MAG: primase C-terminal domain-containing protein [Candidatus Zixiibacteriota bacterium]
MIWSLGSRIYWSNIGLLNKKTKRKDAIMTHNEMKFPDYCYADTALGDVRRRNKVLRIDEINIPHPPSECYMSMFRFREEYKEHCEVTGSVREIGDMACYCDYLWFDIDDNDLETARGKAINLLARLATKFDVHDLSLYFSGSKGFHIGIPSDLFGAEPGKYLPGIFKKMAVEIAGDIKIDTAIYDKNRLWRMPDSINGKSGFYKIQITDDELAQDIDAIKKLAAQHRRDDLITASQYSESSHTLTELYNNIKRQLEQAEIRPEIRISKPLGNIKKPCIEKLLKGVNQGQRNEVCIRLADHFRKEEIKREETLSRLNEWNKLNDSPMEEVDIVSTVESAYSGEYDYGCNDELLKENCSDKCGLFKKEAKIKPNYIGFVKGSDNSLIEMLYDAKADPPTYYAQFLDGEVDYIDQYKDNGTGKVYLPFKVNRLIESGTIRFPSSAVEYHSEANLIQTIDRFIRKYLAVSEFFHTLSVYYVLLSYVYDRFTNLPYLRARGDYGCGKSRFLMTVGSICYKPIFCMGAASVSPIFRMIETYRGTMIIDESDFNDSDDSNKIVKILNTGFQSGFPVLLSESVANNKFEPTSFDVFGPKLIASRHEFKDKALESRCLTEIMGTLPPPEIPINLPLSFGDEARDIRNMLLLWRFRKWHQIEAIDYNNEYGIEPRLAQIMIPLLSIIEDESAKEKFLEFMQSRNQQLIEDRGESRDGLIAEVVCSLWTDPNFIVRIKRVCEDVNSKIDNPKFEVSNRKMGPVLRKTFNLKLDKDRDGTFIIRSKINDEKIAIISKKYGLDTPPQRSQSSQSMEDNEPQEIRL